MELLRRILSLFPGRDRPRVFATLALQCVGAVLETVGVGLILPFVALVVDPSNAAPGGPLHPLADALGNPPHARLVVLSAGILLAFYAAKNLYLFLVARRLHALVHRGMANALVELYEATLLGPYARRLTRNVADVQRLLNVDTHRAFAWVVTPMLVMVGDGFVLLVITALLVAVDPLACAAAAAVFGSVGAVYLVAGRSRLRALGTGERRAQGAMFRWVDGGLGSLAVARVLGIEGFFVRRFGERARSFAAARSAMETANDVPRLVFETVAVAAVVGVVAVVTARSGDAAELVPTVAVFAAAALRMLPAASRIARSVNVVKQSLPAFDAVLAERSARRRLPDRPAEDPGDASFERELAFRSVAFAYEGEGPPVLDDVSFSIGRGECIGIAGPSGAGKTTVVALILGLLEPTGGSILVDGRAAEAGRRGWRHLCGYVPQRIHLLDDTIRRNVALGVDDAAIDDAGVWRALEEAQLAAFAKSLPGGLDHSIGEDGALLSGGQRQRLGIARALYPQPQVLVFDEATSALDADTEHEVQTVVRGLAGGRTVVVVAHRAEALAHCDRVLVFADGRLTGVRRQAPKASV